ncbi:MAG TPA: hypothetical protein VN519_06150 [Bryobacteraceae bacterium]|nr:hypothetical protein [Bryobacteraceae bacterium]
MLIRSINAFLISIAFVCIASAQNAYSPITGSERVRWLAGQNFGPAGVLEDVGIAAESTRVNSPREYGTHWTGFEKRFGMITANYGVTTTMEAGLGSLWGEDPRYARSEGRPFINRLGRVVKLTFLAHNRAGNTVPAYARLLAIPGASFAANAWMPDSQATLSDAALRTGLSFLGRMGANAYREFRPRH